MTSCYISLALALTLTAKSRLSSTRIFWKNKVEAPTSLPWAMAPYLAEFSTAAAFIHLASLLNLFGSY